MSREHALPHDRVVGVEVRTVEHEQEQRECGGRDRDHLDRGPGAGAPRLDPQTHVHLRPGERGEPTEEVAEPLGALVGSKDERRHHEVARRVVDVVRELTQRGGEAPALESGCEPQHLGTDRPRGDSRGRDDRLLEPPGPGHRVAQHLGPARDGFDPVELRLAPRLSTEQARAHESGDSDEERRHGPPGEGPHDDGRGHAEREPQGEVLEPVTCRRTPLPPGRRRLLDRDRPHRNCEQHEAEREQRSEETGEHRHGSLLAVPRVDGLRLVDGRTNVSVRGTAVLMVKGP